MSNRKSRVLSFLKQSLAMSLAYLMIWTTALTGLPEKAVADETTTTTANGAPSNGAPDFVQFALKNTQNQLSSFYDIVTKLPNPEDELDFFWLTKWHWVQRNKKGEVINSRSLHDYVGGPYFSGPKLVHNTKTMLKSFVPWADHSNAKPDELIVGDIPRTHEWTGPIHLRKTDEGYLEIVDPNYPKREHPILSEKILGFADDGLGIYIIPARSSIATKIAYMKAHNLKQLPKDEDIPYVDRLMYYSKADIAEAISTKSPPPGVPLPISKGRNILKSEVKKGFTVGIDDSATAARLTIGDEVLIAPFSRTRESVFGVKQIIAHFIAVSANKKVALGVMGRLLSTGLANVKLMQAQIKKLEAANPQKLADPEIQKFIKAHNWKELEGVLGTTLGDVNLTSRGFGGHQQITGFKGAQSPFVLDGHYKYLEKKLDDWEEALKALGGKPLTRQDAAKTVGHIEVDLSDAYVATILNGPGTTKNNFENARNKIMKELDGIVFTNLQGRKNVLNTTQLIIDKLKALQRKTNENDVKILCEKMQRSIKLGTLGSAIKDKHTLEIFIHKIQTDQTADQTAVRLTGMQMAGVRMLQGFQALKQGWKTIETPVMAILGLCVFVGIIYSGWNYFHTELYQKKLLADNGQGIKNIGIIFSHMNVWLDIGKMLAIFFGTYGFLAAVGQKAYKLKGGVKFLLVSLRAGMFDTFEFFTGIWKKTIFKFYEMQQTLDHAKERSKMVFHKLRGRTVERDNALLTPSVDRTSRPISHLIEGLNSPFNQKLRDVQIEIAKLKTSVTVLSSKSEIKQYKKKLRKLQSQERKIRASANIEPQMIARFEESRSILIVSLQENHKQLEGDLKSAQNNITLKKSNNLVYKETITSIKNRIAFIEQKIADLEIMNLKIHEESVAATRLSWASWQVIWQKVKKSGIEVDDPFVVNQVLTSVLRNHAEKQNIELSNVDDQATRIHSYLASYDVFQNLKAINPKYAEGYNPIQSNHVATSVLQATSGSESEASDQYNKNLVEIATEEVKRNPLLKFLKAVVYPKKAHFYPAAGLLATFTIVTTTLYDVGLAGVAEFGNRAHLAFGTQGAPVTEFLHLAADIQVMEAFQLFAVSLILTAFLEQAARKEATYKIYKDVELYEDGFAPVTYLKNVALCFMKSATFFTKDGQNMFYHTLGYTVKMAPLRTVMFTFVNGLMWAWTDTAISVPQLLIYLTILSFAFSFINLFFIAPFEKAAGDIKHPLLRLVTTVTFLTLAAFATGVVGSQLTIMILNTTTNPISFLSISQIIHNFRTVFGDTAIMLFTAYIMWPLLSKGIVEPKILAPSKIRFNEFKERLEQLQQIHENNLKLNCGKAT